MFWPYIDIHTKGMQHNFSPLLESGPSVLSNTQKQTFSPALTTMEMFFLFICRFKVFKSPAKRLKKTHLLQCFEHKSMG